MADVPRALVALASVGDLGGDATLLGQLGLDRRRDPPLGLEPAVPLAFGVGPGHRDLGLGPVGGVFGRLPAAVGPAQRPVRRAARLGEQRRFDQLLHLARPSPRARVSQITPELAGELLGRHPGGAEAELVVVLDHLAHDRQRAVGELLELQVRPELRRRRDRAVADWLPPAPPRRPVRAPGAAARRKGSPRSWYRCAPPPTGRLGGRDPRHPPPLEHLFLTREHVFEFYWPVLRPDAGPSDPATPLAEVTFCVLDLETTGGAPADDAITEIGAVLVRGGESLGTFQTFVHPGISIPARITYLTGITESMVGNAPRPETVLPTLLEFLGGAVDRRPQRPLRPRLPQRGVRPRRLQRRARPPAVDTCALARRLVRDEVPDCRLVDAGRTGCDSITARPIGRSTDALATTDLLHRLLERAAAYAVFRLDDLLTLPRLAGHPYAAKLRLTDGAAAPPGRL